MTVQRRLRLAVLISGTGSNMVAIARACTSGQIAADMAMVIADQPTAGGINRARDMGIPTQIVDRAQYRQVAEPGRAPFETALAAAIDTSNPDFVILAGFMRILSPEFVTKYAGRMLNIHPSLLPRYKGLHTHERALAAGDATHGATVHFVSAKLDDGPRIVQAEVPVHPGDDPATLSARVHAQEHIIYPLAIEWLAAGRLQWNNGAPTLDGVSLTAPVRLT